MQKHAWLSDTLVDLLNYAALNNLPEVALRIRDVMEALPQDIARQAALRDQQQDGGY